MQAFNLRPSWRLITPQKQQKVTPGESSLQRNAKNGGRTDYVYENKGNLDKMASKKSDIYRKVKRFSRDLQICGPKLPVNCASSAGSS
jgi:hypothetical protein